LGGICGRRIKTKFHNLHIISVHAPTDEKGAKEKETFNQKMEEAYDICPSNNITVLMGDLNQKRFTEIDRKT
jgi:exonuclease III